jgi:hypothetical protein
VAFRSFPGLVLAVATCATSVAAAAQTPPSPPVQTANGLLDLFSQACMKNLGKPDGVRAWAADHHLTSIGKPDALQVYGGGDGGAVWAVATPAEPFVLALRASTQACAVFADKADPQTIEIYVGDLMQALKQTGRPVALLKNDQTPTSFGNRHGLVYAVGGGSWPTLQVYTVITNERPGGPYQATVQVLAKAAKELGSPPLPPSQPSTN